MSIKSLSITCIKCINLTLNVNKIKSSSYSLGGLYALVAAHVALLILNWHSDAFALRQRLNFFGTFRTGTLRPEAMMLGKWKRIGRLIFAVLTLGITLKFEWCTENNCEHGVSHATHVFGALAGLLSGCVFLRTGRSKRPIQIAQNILLVLIYGSALLLIFGGYMSTDVDEWCSWEKFHKICQKRCYLKEGNCIQNHCT